MYNSDPGLDQGANPRLGSPSRLRDRESEETMPDFTMALHHRLSRDEVTARIKNLLQDVKKQYAKGMRGYQGGVGALFLTLWYQSHGA
jgi:hypothetical protein